MASTDDWVRALENVDWKSFNAEEMAGFLRGATMSAERKGWKKARDAVENIQNLTYTTRIMEDGYLSIFMRGENEALNLVLAAIDEVKPN
jgi:hypothetical protein